MTTHVICSRCGKPMRLEVIYGTDAPTQGFCLCPPPVGWGLYTLAPVDWRDAELARLSAELARLRADLAEARDMNRSLLAQLDEHAKRNQTSHNYCEKQT